MNKIILLSITFCIAFMANAQKHVSWTLDGAEERIEKYRKSNTQLLVYLPDGTLLPKGSEVEIELKNHAFNFGISLTQMHAIMNEPFRDELLSYVDNVFNYNTLGFYWSANEKQRGVWKMSEPYQFGFDWAKRKGKVLRGHPLVWHNSIPKWIRSGTRDVDEIHDDIITHLKRLLNTYPEIDEWDIYNEAPSTVEIRDYVGETNGVVRWVDSRGGQGPAVKILSDIMQQIRPEADILINHFQHEHESYHDLIDYCLSNNVPIKSIGIQAHMQEESSVWTEQEMWELMEKYSRHGLPIDFTEVTICSCELVEGWKEMRDWQDSLKSARKNGKQKPTRKTSSKYEKYQADYAHDFYTLAFSHPSVDTIVLWALSDKGSWRDFPAGVFDEKGKPKLIYKMLKNLINNEWHTHVKGRTRKDGEVPLNGFLGEYLITASLEGKEYTAHFELNNETGELLDIYLK